MKVGDLEILPVIDGTGREQAREVLTAPGDDRWACHPEHLDADGNLELTLGGFLVRTGDRVVLVDAGVGRIRNDHYAGGGFLDALAALGVTPDQVTDVVFTHLHFDHVGWATSRGEVVFDRATYRVHEADWVHFVEAADADPGAVRKLAPLRERLETFDAEHTVVPGLDARPTPGHTPGSTTYVVSGRGQRALLIGDVAHSVVELEEPDWQATFDVDPLAAQAMRRRLADEVADTDDLVVPAHLPGLAWGRIVTFGETRRFVAV
ncbi:glyoxylase-like metal-dependent hydrolase (beta-lactamase superfamily II) [Actinomycetospora succinea]|uniref:Glyoxylase-like metal-dependent hydrolase (Beta-lactamase superfamily II) n=1 Tax=Actinomycetospora succinea TaxID=663603 RepID=A0A4R6VNL3_9PSEU|nr:MBL fold metallo-hydrolase [Actinomycetospora succinea]TDQ65459.1 glyoxylase-like metal-dependent hydrolase (beta-lactamase superfamily II) [Actinomycetospora succinea]